MKKLVFVSSVAGLLLLSVAGPLLVFAQSENFTLRATVSGLKAPAKVYIKYPANGRMVTDSALVSQGGFQISGNISGPVMAQLLLDRGMKGLGSIHGNSDLLTFYLEKGTITLAAKDSIRNAVITGSGLNDQFREYKQSFAGPERIMTAADNEFSAAPESLKKDSAYKAGLEGKYRAAEKEKKVLQLVFIKQHPDAYFSLVALKEITGQNIDDSTTALFNSLSDGIRHSPDGERFAKRLEVAMATAIGKIAPDFTQNDVNDQPVKLSSFRGKYVLLDFWASWCGPCRQENPNVVKTYNEYKDRNFTVLGVSLDKPGDKAAWTEAIKADNLSWTEVSDLKSVNEAAKLYGVDAIPQNFLIDPSGRIIAKNLRGEVLRKKLQAIIGGN